MSPRVRPVGVERKAHSTSGVVTNLRNQPLRLSSGGFGKADGVHV